MHSHPDVWRVFGDDPGDVVEAAIGFVDGFLSEDPWLGRAPFAVEADPTMAGSDGHLPDGPIGIVGLFPTRFEPPFAHLEDPCVEIGWRLHRRWWGQGLATEAALACLDFARTDLGLAEVVAFTSAGNDRSLAVMRRIGMVRDPGADFEHPRLAPGDPRRSHVVCRTAWPS